MRLVNNQVQYIEFLSGDLPRIKNFYSEAFNWDFTDYGDDYTAFSGTHIDGGFAKGESRQGSVLVILYSDDLQNTLDKVKQAGGEIVQEIFSFPGGQRFHFSDPDGNELAVWSDK